MFRSWLRRLNLPFCAQFVATELKSTFVHDPRFGSPLNRPGKKLYVGNLPFSATDQAFASGLRQTTSMDGSYAKTVESAKIIMDRDTGRSKGFGFIVAATD